MAAGRGPPPGIMGLLGPLLLGDGQALVGACFVKDSAPGFHASVLRGILSVCCGVGVGESGAPGALGALRAVVGGPAGAPGPTAAPGSLSSLVGDR